MGETKLTLSEDGLNAEFNFNDHGWRAAAEVEHPEAAEIAINFVEWFRAVGAINFLSVRMMEPKSREQFELLIQRSGGKTPGERIAELVAENVMLRERINDLLEGKDKDA